MNYKLGLDWTVVYGLRAARHLRHRLPRPQRAGAVRRRAEGNLTTTDPCSRYSDERQRDADRQLPGLRRARRTTSSSSNTILTTVGGNQNLTAGRAENLTLGTVFQPEFVPGLSLTADYFDIDIEDAIRAIPGSTKLSVCYNTPNLSHPFCAAELHPQPADRRGELPVLPADQHRRRDGEGLDFGVRYTFDVARLRADARRRAHLPEGIHDHPLPRRRADHLPTATSAAATAAIRTGGV